jgi:hypothetical protein
MRTIRVSQGFTDFAEGILTEVDSKDLTLTDKRIALVAAGSLPPAPGTDGWKTPDRLERLADHRWRLSLFVDSSYALGQYYLWALPVDNPTETPVQASNHMIVLI